MTTKCMYLGPTIRGVAKSGTVFEGGLPKKLSTLAEKKPIINNLIVPLNGIVAAKAAIDKEGTAEAVAYDKIAAMTDDEVKKLMEGE